jgi:aspartyl/asparaginyl beta-hydroxylase (cupin superfamily)
MADDASPAANVIPPTLDEAEAERRLAQNRFDLPALVAKADHRFRAGDHRAAAAFYAFIVKSSAAGLSVPADAAAVERAAQLRDWLADRFRHHILSSLEAAGFASRDWPERFRDGLEIMFGDRPRDLVVEQFPQLPNIFFYPDLPYVDFVDPELFPWRAQLEAQFPELREEASALLANTADFSPYVSRTLDRPQGDVHGLLENSDWSSLYLWNHGNPVEENADRCPKTFLAVTSLPLCRIGKLAPAALFSLLKPGAHIPPHTGMLNIRYICHLPLIVPQNCSFRVGERTVEWEEGKLLVFDDSVEHEARNGSDQDRLVLIFDVWNPHLSVEEVSIIRTMLEVVDDYR